MKATMISEEKFSPKGATKYPCVYTLSEYPVKNGMWYRVEYFADLSGTPYHRFKNYRSKVEAEKEYTAEVNLEMWRQEKV